MNKKQFKKLLRECIEDVLAENLGEDPNNPLYVEYLKPMAGEQPFVMNGEKFEYCWAKYPNGKQDIGVYAYAGDMCYGYQAFRQRYGIKETDLNEMSTTGEVQGFMGKNFLDPDPERKHIKKIAAKSVGGKVS